MPAEDGVWRWSAFDDLSGREVHDLLALRMKVFVVEQACAFAEIDGQDPDAIHLRVFAGDELTGCLRVFAPSQPGGRARIGRIATARVRRGTGLGHRMVIEALRFCAERFAGHAIDLSAQAHLSAFYARHGFTPVSKPYLEDGIPHLDMRRPAARTALQRCHASSDRPQRASAPSALQERDHPIHQGALMPLETVSTAKAHGGVQGVYRHASSATGTEMTFAVFVPPHAEGAKLPVVWYLSGLTCTHANVMDKGEYRRLAAELGLIVVAPDTSPRGEGVADDQEGAYDMGLGAGFYLDATQEPYARHYKMETYVTEELPALIAASFPADLARQSIMGHSMGGHGALTLGLKHAGRFKAVSAFAPIVAPSLVPWGHKALPLYLGDDEAAWRRHDAVALIEDGARVKDLLVDQGEADNFLCEQLKPELLEKACNNAGIALTLRRQPGYDHSYNFISTFMDDHLRWHADRL